MIPGYLVENGYVVVKQCRHGLFMFNRNDRFVGRSLDLYGEWCEPELELLLGLVGEGDTVVDVGANIGTHAVAFARAAGVTGRVVAFEPQRVSFQFLCGNAALNRLVNIDARLQAAGAGSGRVKVPVLAPEESRNFAAVAVGAEIDGEDVDLVSIDSLALPSCRLIKIDVEGMEAEVIRGASATIAAHRPALFVENNTLDGASRTIDAIEAAGYRGWWHLALYYNDKNFYANAENVFAKYQPEANLLCLPAGDEPGRDDLIACTGAGDNWRAALERGIAARNPRYFPKARRKRPVRSPSDKARDEDVARKLADGQERRCKLRIQAGPAGGNAQPVADGLGAGKVERRAAAPRDGIEAAQRVLSGVIRPKRYGLMPSSVSPALAAASASHA